LRFWLNDGHQLGKVGFQDGSVLHQIPWSHSLLHPYETAEQSVLDRLFNKNNWGIPIHSLIVAPFSFELDSLFHVFFDFLKPRYNISTSLNIKLCLLVFYSFMIYIESVPPEVKLIFE
jgi:hypothetical protein